jgi:hypothetical protein
MTSSSETGQVTGTKDKGDAADAPGKLTGRFRTPYPCE